MKALQEVGSAFPKIQFVSNIDQCAYPSVQKKEFCKENVLGYIFKGNKFEKSILSESKEN